MNNKLEMLAGQSKNKQQLNPVLGDSTEAVGKHSPKAPAKDKNPYNQVLGLPQMRSVKKPEKKKLSTITSPAPAERMPDLGSVLVDAQMDQI